MSSKISRRNLIAFAAALPAVAIAPPALAVILPATPTVLKKSVLTAADPIFALIENHRRLNASCCTLNRARDDLEGSLPNDVTRIPCVATYPKRDGKATLIEKTADYQIIRHDEGPATREMYYASSPADLKKEAKYIPKRDRAAWLADRRSALNAEQRRVQKVKDETGVHGFIRA